MMRAIIGFLSLACAVACPAAGDLRAQSAADSVAIMRALGESVTDQPITAIANRIACYHAPTCTEEELAAASRFLRSVADAATLPLVAPPPVARVPHCPPPERRGAVAPGYLLYVGVPQIRGDSARIAVARACEWSPAARDPILWLGEEYLIERRNGTWGVVQRRFMWRS